jgi:hypothetical protein
MPLVRPSLRGVVLVLAVVIMSPASGALADPIQGTHKEVFPVTCSGQTLLVVGGKGAAAQVVDDQDVLIPASFVQVSSWTDPTTGQVVTQTDAFSVGQGNRTGQQDQLTTCRYTADFADPEVGTVHVDGTVRGFFASGS